jgi:hypothetical protein
MLVILLECVAAAVIVLVAAWLWDSRSVLRERRRNGGHPSQNRAADGVDRRRRFPSTAP